MSFEFLNHKKVNHYLVFAFLLMLLSTTGFAQKSKTISGVVSDSNGITIPGVNIVEKGTNNSVSTDLDGKFKLNVQGPKSVLVFSYIGYDTFTQVVGDKTTFKISMANTGTKLEEIVVVGFGSVKKSDLTGSVVSVSGNDLKKLSMASVAETLTGRVAGVQVTSSEGSPDSDIKIRIRGGGSLTQDGTPLYIVDGFPVNSISDISPSDIENISILKDASSTAIYGSRGANGVIIVTTKSGSKNGKISVNYNAFYGPKTIDRTIGVLNPQDYALWQYEYAVLKNDLPSYENPFGPWQPNQYAGVVGTNWQKEIYGRTGSTESHDFGIRGGSDKVNYNFTYTNYDEKAIMIGSSFKRNNFSFNIKNKPNDKVDLSLTMRYSDTKITGSGANDQKEVSSSDARLRHSVGYAPIPLPGVTTDNTDEAISTYLVNPFVAVADNDRLQKRKNYNLLGSFSWKLIDNLTYRADFGFDNYYIYDNRFYGRSTYYAGNVPAAENQDLPSTVIGNRTDLKLRNANTLNYDLKKYLNDKHSLKILVGQESINYQSTINTAVTQGFPKYFSFENATNLSSQGVPLFIDNFIFPDDKLLSFFGRVNYDFNNKYLLTATYRADGSSKFLGSNRWGYFPSVAAAWKISEEKFLKNTKWIDLVKLRLSYGQAGNNNIPTGQTIQTFQSTISTYINGVTDYWAPSKILANPDLKWETTVTNNIGLDYEIFKGKLTGTFEVYKNVTKDLLVKFPIPGSGYDYQYRNMGETQNTGFEASLNYAPVRKDDYGLSLSFNIGFNKNRINSLGVMSDFGIATNWASTAIGNDFIVKVGEPIGLMYGYQNDGRYEVADFDYIGGIYTLKPGVANASTIVGNVRPGSMKLKDLNGDGIINLNDQTIIGNANPLHTGGFVLNANAYGFDLMTAFNWSFGNDIYNANKIEFNTSNPVGQYRNLTTMMQNGTRWTNIDSNTGQQITDPTALAALNATTTMWSPNMGRYVFSDWAVEDGSFLRLNTVSLGYTFPKSFTTKLGISKLRLYETVSNVFVLTNYSGLDPEVSTRRDTPLTPGVDYSPYPRNRQIVFGLNVSF